LGTSLFAITLGGKADVWGSVAPAPALNRAWFNHCFLPQIEDWILFLKMSCTDLEGINIRNILLSLQNIFTKHFAKNVNSRNTVTEEIS